MLSGLLKTAATDPKLKGLISHVGDPTLSIATIDQARPWAIGALAQKAGSSFSDGTTPGSHRHRPRSRRPHRRTQSNVG